MLPDLAKYPTDDKRNAAAGEFIRRPRRRKGTETYEGNFKTEREGRETGLSEFVAVSWKFKLRDTLMLKKLASLEHLSYFLTAGEIGYNQYEAEEQSRAEIPRNLRQIPTSLKEREGGADSIF